MRVHRPLVGVAVSVAAVLSALTPMSASRAGAKPSPIPVVFGPNVNLSVQSSSQGKYAREPTIVVNPANPLDIVEGNIVQQPTQFFGVDTFSFSTDGGQTWTLGGIVPMENPGDDALDPALAADAEGNIYYSYLTDVLGTAGTNLRTDLRVAKSTDGGRSFPSSSIVASSSSIFIDKDYIGVDAWATSPFKGTIYVAWTEFVAGGDQIKVAVSRDGAARWSKPVGASQSVDSATRTVTDGLPVVAPDGTVYLFYDNTPARGSVAPTTSIQFTRSNDRGKTWSPPANVASGLLAPFIFRLKNDDPQWASKDLVGVPANPTPSAAIASDGTIFVAWTDVSHGSCVDTGGLAPPCTNSDVRLAVSHNGGKSWSAPVKVGDDADAADQFNPWIAVHPNGLLSLTWQDKRLDPDNINFDTFYTNTFDGSSFLPNVRVSSATSLSGNGATPVNDYIGMAASADSVFPVWTDMRSGSADVYTATGRLMP